MEPVSSRIYRSKWQLPAIYSRSCAIWQYCNSQANFFQRRKAAFVIAVLTDFQAGASLAAESEILGKVNADTFCTLPVPMSGVMVQTLSPFAAR
ncbi:Uncharacterised protein [Serratia entomophila]|nr:Uncharacterised protein [Serratia entomophila]CAI0786157.1 Uncharacterised protein [Serratia entomophila]CAI0786777.1 Uncharacterised protein [Serratia entomophila]CAI0786805.1 Uncharacterised protein [Serratia entomophila]CAI0788411.1 Uncharacterised protein [Serratia entomophila]